MRNLDAINLQFMRPSKVALWGPVLPIFAGTLGWVLAGHIRSVPMAENPLVILSCAVLIAACLLFVIPICFGWGWRAEYFGIALFYVGSISLLFAVPFFCLIFYGNLGLWIESLMLMACVVIHFKWCYRFVVYYRKIYFEHDLFSLLYVEEDDAVYYMQKVDEYFFDKLIPLRQTPSDLLVIACLLLAVILAFCMEFVKGVTGLSFIYTFMAFAGLPVSLMCLGLATRGWLVFYFYPMKIRLSTGKIVYVDMENVPERFKERIRLWKKNPKSFKKP